MLPMTQEQLADALGLTPVHTNRTLMALGSEGLISRTKRAVRIEDWSKLAGVGDFERRYLHLPPSMPGAAHGRVKWLPGPDSNRRPFD